MILTVTAAAAIGASIVSFHRKPGYETVTPGLYIIHAGYIAGGVVNSHGDVSLYAGKHWQTELRGGKELGLSLGVITGYKNPAPPIMPMILLSYQPSKEIPIVFTYIPRPPIAGASDAIHISFKKAF